jgi:hypothetical protein
MLEQIFQIAIIVGSGAAAAARYFKRDLRVRRALLRAKAWPIGDLPPNTFGRVTGVANPVDHPLIAPLTGRPCVYYRVTVENNSAPEESAIVVGESSGVPFLLEDDSGIAVVDPAGAEVTVDFDHWAQSGIYGGASAAQEALLVRHGRRSRGPVFDDPLTYREAILGVGETVSVVGAGVREPAPGEPYRAAGATFVRMHGPPRIGLLIQRATVAR